MPFPDGVQTVTLTAGAAGYRTLDGDPYQGTIRLTPSVPRVVSVEHGVIALGSENITVGASGEFTATVLACDADGFSPSGWTYRVDEEFTNAPGRAYSILLPAAVPSVALPSLVEVEASTGTVSTPAVVSVNGNTGVVTGLLEAANNLSDLASAGASRTSLGLGGAAILSVGTSAGTVAAGDDSRIAGAVQKTANLSDLVSASTARTNLGLGGAATLSVGTIAGTVAAGDDARLSDARTPTAHAGSHAFAGSDPVTVAQSQVTGLSESLAAKADGAAASTDNALARFDGATGKVLQNSTVLVGDDGSVTITGNLTDAGNFIVRDSHTTPTKAYRFRSGGGALDTESGGTDWYWSTFPNPDFSGAQNTLMRWEATAPVIHMMVDLQVKAAPFGPRVHTLDGPGAKAGFYGAEPVGRPPVAGSWADGTAGQALAAALAQLGLITNNTTG